MLLADAAASNPKKGSDSKLVAVPDVRKSSLGEARARVEAAGLVFVVANREIRAGTVLSQNPAEGTKVKAGSTVTVTLQKAS